MRTPVTTYRIPVDLIAKLDALAKANGESRTDVLVRILRSVLG